jgi:hypothetical protein
MQPVGAASAAGRIGAGVAGAIASDWRSALARSGLVAKGVLYGGIGLLAIQVAAGDAASGSASSRGAIELVATQPFGQWLLALLTVGLFALAAWQSILAVTGDPVEGRSAKDRAKFAAKAVVYLGTAMTALAILLAHWGSSQRLPGASGGDEASRDQATAVVMGWPGGPWLVGLAGLAVIAFALQQFYNHAWHRKFMRRLARSRMDGGTEQVVERAGRAGYAARATVLATVGVFFVVAALELDPHEAVGLSGALNAVSQQAWGEAALWLVAVGLVLYGCFCFAEARYRRAT